MPDNNVSNRKTNIQEPCNSWVFLLKRKLKSSLVFFLQFSLAENTTNDHENDIVILRHPNNGETGAFLFSKDNRYIQEILTYIDDKRSWFIDESVKSSGTLKISTPIDPIFLVLPYLRGENSATLLDQLLHDDMYPETKRLLQCEDLKYLTCVADETVLGDIVAYKYNERKTLGWLKKKTDTLVKMLKLNNIHLTSDATSATFKKTNRELLDDNIYLRYAADIVSEYLSKDLSKKLIEYLNLPQVVPPQIKRKSDVHHDMHHTKKHKPTVKETRAVVKSSKLRPTTYKTPTTNRTITSFFKKN